MPPGGREVPPVAMRSLMSQWVLGQPSTAEAAIRPYYGRCVEGAIAISVAVLLAQRAAAGASGAKGWTTVDELDVIVRRRFASDRVAASILNDLAANPDDEGRIRAAAHLIQVGAAHDRVFRATVERLIRVALTSSLSLD
jgi:hypothetical protein